MKTLQKLKVIYTDLYLKWQLGDGDGSHPTNPVRAELATQMLTEKYGEDVVVVDPIDPAKEGSDMDALRETHDEKFIEEVLAGRSGEWTGTKPELGQTALAMFKGTIRAVEAILSGVKVVFNPQGAKHHAKYDRSSGFCVFNDMTYAALALQAKGLRPLYIDWDIHAGDGVAEMLSGTGIPRISIHGGNNFPYDRRYQVPFGECHDEADHCYNFNVGSFDGDEVFMECIDKAREIIEAYKPDVILLAAGADGHTGLDNLSGTNTYTAVGFTYAAEMVAEMAIKHADGRVLIGGAGGYQPYKETPETWALVVGTIFDRVREGVLAND
jgi:acetoin utilization protein AcuC